ncbi:DUF5320 domain-containing protein [Calorimonas adulescens]|jgi:hypothetical protein|uniref:DUF5320 domain-containing protein n=1 Tax=Calorimonas adulescens TaxID=2606906 RepID=A0A5D8Q8X6_9THEO|nr:DUF5320 domain-containing protein [Calorimonas adulescens]TZE80942.1 hypothetical protein FWJ32_11130 [Calorimonas adulescens]
MPRGDGTGPMGLGPMTGRRMGFCAGYNRPGYMGFGRYPMRFWRNPYHPYYAPWWYDEEIEKNYLQAEAKYLEKELEEIKKRLDQLNKGE